MACTCSSCLDHTSTNHHVDIYPFSLGSHHAILSRGNLLFYISDMFDRYFCAQLQRSTTLTSRLTPPCHFRHIVEGSRKIYVVFLDGDVRSLASYNIKERIEIWYWHILLIDFWTQKKANFTFLRTRVRRVRRESLSVPSKCVSKSSRTEFRVDHVFRFFMIPRNGMDSLSLLPKPVMN